MKIPKDIVSKEEARGKILAGVSIVADAVGSTLGPKGRNVAINNLHGVPEVIHDGVTVSRRINLKDPFEDMGAELIKMAAEKTVIRVGDGTTTATILARAIIIEAYKQIAAGVNPVTIQKELEKNLPVLLAELDKLSRPIKSDEEIEFVATVSSTDSTLGKLVAEAIVKVGQDGIVTVEEGKGFDTTVTYKTGMEIDRGYTSPEFKTNEKTEEAIIEDPYILLTDKEIRFLSDLLPFIDKFLKTSKKLVIFAGNVSDEALVTLVLNKIRGAIEVIAVQAPAFGGRRIDELEDMARYTGGVVITRDSGRRLDSVQIEELGRAEKIISDRDKTIILNGKGSQEAIDKRIAEIHAQIENANTDFDRDIKKQRLGNLSGKAAVIYVGAIDEVSMRDKKERVIDAVAATKAGIQGGIVAGGEITLYALSSHATGILKNALKAPFIKLLENAGIDYAQALQKLGDYPQGIDVMDEQPKDLIKAGIIDPVLVTKTALQNAVSIAGIVITCESLITDSPIDK